MANRPRGGAVWWWLAGGLLASAAVFHGLYLGWTGSLGSAPRNPHYSRGWPEYIAATPAKREGEFLVVLISNSQGYGMELPFEKNYASRLQGLLRHRGSPVRVVNWSIPGARYEDFLLASASAAGLRPDQIIVVLPTTVLGGKGRARGTGWKGSSDLYRRWSDAGFRGRVPEAVWTASITPRMKPGLWLGSVYPAWCWRGAPVGWLARHRLLADLLPEEREWVWQRPRAELERRGTTSPAAVGMNPAAAVTLLEVLQRSCPQVLAVQMPFRSDWRVDPDRAWAPFAALARKRGVETLALRGALPDAFFISHSHLTSGGHRQMAQILAGSFQ